MKPKVEYQNISKENIGRNLLFSKFSATAMGFHIFFKL